MSLKPECFIQTANRDAKFVDVFLPAVLPGLLNAMLEMSKQEPGFFENQRAILLSEAPIGAHGSSVNRKRACSADHDHQQDADCQ